MTFKFSTGAQVIKGVTPWDDFPLSVLETPTYLSPTVSYTTQADMVYSVSTSAGTTNNAKLTIASGVTAENLTPSVCTLVDGQVTRLTDGLARVKLFKPGIGTKVFERNLTVLGTTSSNLVSSYASGSLANHTTTVIDGLIAGNTAGSATQDVFTSYTYDLNFPAGVRNSGNFAYAFDFTPTSFFRNSGNPSFPATLISPRHLVSANHVQAGIGAKIIWEKGGSFYSANVIGYAGLGWDIGISYLDAPVSAITPAYFLPDNYASYLPSTKNVPPVNNLELAAFMYQPNAGMSGSQQTIINTGSSHIRVVSLGAISTPLSGLYANVMQSEKQNRAAWTHVIYGGDSGSPVYIPIHGKLALVTSLFSLGGGPDYVANRLRIEGAMNELSSLYNSGGGAVVINSIGYQVNGSGTDLLNGSYRMQQFGTTAAKGWVWNGTAYAQTDTTMDGFTTY